MAKLYYTKPPDEIFNEVKQACIDLWQEVASNSHYAEEKIGYVKGVGNISDNMMTLVALFDQNNMSLLADKLSGEARVAIRERMIDGGNPSFLIPF